MHIYDISRTLHERIAVWPGDQKFRLRWVMSIEQGDSCNVSAITMSVHTGTHLDAPYHFEEAGLDVASLQLEPYIGPARVVQVPAGTPSIEAEFLQGLDWDGVERVLFRTGAGDSGDDPFDREFVFLTLDAAEFLVEHEIVLVGTDAPSVDAFDSKAMACHKILNDGDVAILEGARLCHVPPGDYELICLPLKLDGLDGSPVRAVLRSRL